MNDIEREKLRREIFRPKEQTNTSVTSLVNSELLKVFTPQRLERIKKRELRRFKQRQDLKWSRWLEAVSE